MESPHNNPSSDEVNLMPLFRFIYKQLQKLGNFIAFTFKLIEVRFFLLATFAGIGIICGVGYYILASPVYKSNAIYTSNLLSNQYSESFINELQWLTREGNYEELSELLKLDVSEVKKIKKIEYEPFAATSKDTVIGTPFKVNAYVYDNSVLDSLQYKILKYMENIPYALKRKSAKKVTLRDFSEKMRVEMNELDSLKSKVDEGKVKFSVETYKEVLDLYLERALLMERITLLSNYELIQGFSIYRKPYSPRLRDIAYIIIISSFIGLIVAFRKERKKQQKALKDVEIMKNINSDKNVSKLV